MPDLRQKLEELREEYSKTKYNKATNKHLGILRKKMAEIKKALSAKKKVSGPGFAVKKTGDATVALVGFPNTGKSTLLGLLTNAESRVADYAFTTLNVIPGMLEYGGARIQILDIPGLIEGASGGRGRGAEVASVIRSADLVLFMIDVNRPSELYTLLNELDGLGIKVNGERPRIKVEERYAGGVDIRGNGHKIPDRKSVLEILNLCRVHNADVVFYQDADIDDFAEVMEDNIAYKRAIILLNKIDTVEESYAEAMRYELEKLAEMRVVPISAKQSMNIENVKTILLDQLKLIRVYLKPKDGDADFERPLVVEMGSTLFDVAKALHSKIAKNLKCAYITGRSVRFENQRVGKGHIVADGDVVTLVYERGG